MLERTVIIEDDAGIHARPASMLVKFIKGFPDSNITITHAGKKAGANIIQLLSLGVVKGNEITVTVEGGNEQNTLDQVCEFIKNMR